MDPVPVEGRLRDSQPITDAALFRLDDRDLLAELLDRTREALCADTAAVIHALVGAHKRAQSEHGEIQLVISTPVLRIFTITGLGTVIPHSESLEEALEACAGNVD